MRETTDLFGQVPVTWPEVVDWAARVHGITPDSPRFMNFCSAWSIADKVERAKRQGAWLDSQLPHRHP